VRTFKLFLVLAAIAALLAVSLPAQAQGEQPPKPVGLRFDAPPFGVRGAFPVGTREFTIEGAGQDTLPLKGTIWYPALNPNGLKEVVTYHVGVAQIAPALDPVEGRAILDAAPDTSKGPYPLIISSHGHTASRLGLVYLHEHLASWGFVVMAIDHPGDSAVDAMSAQTKEAQAALVDAGFVNLATRASHIRRIIDYGKKLTADGALKDTIDAERVAVIGISLGGQTTMLSAGGRLHFDYLKEWCKKGIYASGIISTICNMVKAGTLVDNENRLAKLAAVSVKPGELWPSIGDPRVDAIVPIMPGAMLAFGIDGLEAVKVPALIFAGSADAMAIPEYNAYWAYDHLGSAQKGMVEFVNGGHVMGASCSPAWVAAMPAACTDPVWDLARAHDLFDHFTTAFLRMVFYSDKDAAAALAPGAVKITGIAYKTTMK
jgi:predicted dienelactone hydrolase